MPAEAPGVVRAVDARADLVQNAGLVQVLADGAEHLRLHPGGVGHVEPLFRGEP